MKLSPDTIKILQNFGTINTNIVFNASNVGYPSNVIQTRSEANNIMAVAEIAEELPEFGIYDLTEFLSAVSMFNDPDFLFDDSMKFLTIKEGRQSVRYHFSDPTILTFPTKKINMPPADVTLTLTEDDLSSIRRAASTFSVNDVIFYSMSGDPTVHAKVTDIGDATANSYEVEVTDSRKEDEGSEFNLLCDIGNLKLIKGDYRVNLSSKLIANFIHTTLPVSYYIAMEKKSMYKGSK